MNYSYEDSVNRELERLRELGWRDFPRSVQGIHVAAHIDHQSISFPKDSYSSQEGNLEAEGFWAVTRAKKIRKILNLQSVDLMWEVGSGHGNVAILLKNYGTAVIAIEPLEQGTLVTANSGIRSYVGTLDKLQFPKNSIKCIGIFDVLEHLENPNEVLDEIYRVLEPGGLLVTSVPAHQWLFSDFDKSIGHFRRYSRKEIVSTLEDSGFLNNMTQFVFSFLVLPAFVLRTVPSKFGRKHTSAETKETTKNHQKMLKLLQPILELLLILENFLRIPFGLSLISVSKKPSNNA
jgi:ubiquinone/menaquinone biosynthesis C-methylase UbiE